MKITFLPEAMVDRLTELGIDYENWAWFWPFWPEVLRGEMCLMTRDYKDGGKLAKCAKCGAWYRGVQYCDRECLCDRCREEKVNKKRDAMAALMVRCVVCGVETAAANYGVSLATEMGVCPRCRAAYTPPRLDWENLYDGDH